MARRPRPPRRTVDRITPVVPLHPGRGHDGPASAGGGIGVAADHAARRSSPGVVIDDAPRRPSGAVANGGSAAAGRARRASRAREAHDGWTFVVIPPGVGARPRTLRVSVRRLRMATAALVGIASTAVVSGGLLAILLSIAPVEQPEEAGLRLGVLHDSAFSAAMSDSALLATTADAPGATPSPADAAAEDERTVATTERRRLIAPPSLMRRRGGEAASADDAPSTEVATTSAGLPVIGRVTSRFANARRHPLLGVVRRHQGVDIAAPQGTAITAPASGRVIFAGRKFGFGNVVEIDHGRGVVTRYAHCRTLGVRAGTTVAAGAQIATVGRTGLASGPHLHFEVLVDGRSVDPLKRPLASLLGTAAPGAAVAAPAPVPATATDSSSARDSTATTAPAGEPVVEMVVGGRW